MSVTVQHINADSSFLLIFSPEAYPTPAQLTASAGAYSVLIDPWVSNGASIVSSPWFAITKRIVPSCIRHLSELEEPDLVIISQNKPDHCHGDTLRQLRPDGKTTIAAEPGAAKSIKKWNYFNPDRVIGLRKFDHNSKFPSYQVHIPALSKGGHQGELCVSFIPAKNYMTGLHNAIGITYQAPTHVKSHAAVSTIDLPQRTQYFHMPLTPATVPAASPSPMHSPLFHRPGTAVAAKERPPSAIDRPRTAGNDGWRPRLSKSYVPGHNPSQSRTHSRVYSQSHHRRATSSVLSQQQEPSNQQLTATSPISPAIDLTFDFELSHQLSPLSSEDEDVSTPNAFFPISSTQALPTPPDTPTMSISGPSNPQDHRSPAAQATHHHHPSENFISLPQSYASPDLSSTTSRSSFIPLATSHSSPSLSPSPYHHTPASSVASTPLTPANGNSFSSQITPARPRTVSVLYTPHGIPFQPDLQPYVLHHLLPNSAIPLTLLLHAFDKANNPWYLGGNIMTGASGGVEIARGLRARCWLSAHDEDKDDQGWSVRKLKVDHMAAEQVRRALWDGPEGEDMQRTGWLCDVRNLEVGKQMTIGPQRDLLAGMEGKRESRLLRFAA